jgi:predicted heme/steroid binding protein
VYRDLECAVYDVSASFVSADGEPRGDEVKVRTL